MKRFTSALLTALTLAALSASPAGAAFGLHNFDVTFTEADGSMATQAGSHPYAMNISFETNTIEGPGGKQIPEEAVKDVVAAQAPGFAGSPVAVPRCSTLNFLTLRGGEGKGASVPKCTDGSAVGRITIILGAEAVGEDTLLAPVYLLEPAPGLAARLGWWNEGVPVVADIELSKTPPYLIIGGSRNITQFIDFYGAKLTLWGNPASPAHDEERGNCYKGGESCPAGVPNKPFLTLPRACTGPLVSSFETDSWKHPGAWVFGETETHDASGNPRGFDGCGKLAFTPEIASRLTTDSAETGSGLDFSVAFSDEGLANPSGLADSDIKKAVITLPPGVTINPSVGEGLGVCTPADLDRETVKSAPGEGCPSASKLGTLHVLSPLVDEAVDGQIFLAQQDDASTTKPGAENPFDSLIALYFVLHNPKLGVIVKEPLLVEPDPETGQLVVTLNDIPQLPLSYFEAHLRTGARAALITPSACGSYTTKATFTPWANPSQPLTTTAAFQISRGVAGGNCPSGGVPPFKPDFQAGSLNNNAGSFSPFNMRLIRKDGEQDMTKFSAVLPPGEVGSLVGVAKCPEAAVAIARAKTGRQELAAPSCPPASEIGHTLAGAGVGEALTYVGGKIYLAGPYKGDPLSVIAITPAVAGPFDAGTVVVRLALTLNPKTAEVEVDGANSDPIPHIIKGIVLKVRDLRVYVDRPNFLLNPTSCDESSADATLFGSYLNVLSPDDDVPVELSSRYQAANCAVLGFKPKLDLQLKGGTKRGGHPGLLATYKPRKGDANLQSLITRLPRSAFLDQAHIRTICTRVQFAADACPKGAQYGYIKAWTPLLEEPLQGPVWLRSSNNKLPDLVFDLHGLVDVEVATRIDSARGGIRAKVESAPDAPLSKVELTMQGGKKGLIINSRNLCGAKSKANVQFDGHNGKRFTASPVMRADCGGKRKAKR